MNLKPHSDQQMMADMFARFLDHNSTAEHVRRATTSGFDRTMWQGLAELGALGIRVPENCGGLGLGIFDAGLLMEEAGRRLASGPLAEAIVAIRLLSLLDPNDKCGLREQVMRGDKLLTLALHDTREQEGQLVAGAAVADAVIFRDGDEIALLRFTSERKQSEPTLASTSIARLHLGEGERVVLARGDKAVRDFQAAVEEWKLLIGLKLIGLARESIRLASEYACERQQFDRPIGSYQAISHPLANAIIDIDAGQLFLWKAIADIAAGENDAAVTASLACWWACSTAEKAVAQGLHTFGGYGLTLEYDIHLYNLRAKGYALCYGDPQQLLEEAAARLYDNSHVALPDSGPMPIDFELGEDADILAKETDDFFAKHLTPELRAKAHYSWSGHDPDLHRKLGAAGLLFPTWPCEIGGRNATSYAMNAALEIWHKHHWTTHGQATCNMVGYIVKQFGSSSLQDDALTKIAKGEASCALGFTEPESGSDVFAVKTRAVRDGEGWRISGQKMFTSGAEWADYVLLLGRTGDDGAKHQGLTMFLVPMKAEGVTVQPIHTFQDERTNITFYDGIWISDDCRLGEAGEGLTVMSAALNVEHSMTLVKEHEQLYQAALNFCRTRTRNERPLLDDPQVKIRLARTCANITAAQLLNYRALWSKEERLPDLAYGPASKMFSSEVYQRDAFDLLNLTAPESLVDTCPDAAFINQCFRHSQVGTIYGGTSEIHRSRVAEKQLGLPRTR